LHDTWNPYYITQGILEKKFIIDKNDWNKDKPVLYNNGQAIAGKPRGNSIAGKRARKNVNYSEDLQEEEEEEETNQNNQDSTDDDVQTGKPKAKKQKVKNKHAKSNKGRHDPNRKGTPTDNQKKNYRIHSKKPSGSFTN
jgi:hypothetical protein